MSDNVLYRMFSATGDLLYVGITMNPHLRFREHQEKKSWWPEVANIGLEHFDSREALAEAERQAIKHEQPTWNVRRYPEPKPRQRRRPPMVAIHAVRGVLGMDLIEVCERMAKAGVLTTPADVRAFELGADTCAAFVAAYESALRLPSGCIVLDYEPFQVETVS